ncbi:TonB-dependent receptor plug domain-containing protein [Janthinobacterium fluminis]|uniref:TonB-dependent receptor n=1 Tax=Janthinobacterium fluminis TaxID=2987524 RepID=A0ABT5JUK2_9BURK|nr:TonB-dependent receptor [Janthinobacterium fluminis]MDC8756319.1 TonB-dependent receptor [Janthinobacterium fluminis]
MPQHTIPGAARKALAAAILLALGPSWALAQTTPFELGSVTVVGQRAAVGAVGEDQVASVVERADMRRFNRDNVGDALNLLSGVTLSTNSRNEKTIAVRGFDSRQVPLFIDGIPVYVPYDGYVDFNRFSTADLAAVQVAKGFSSVAYGPNTLGGAINLISRKPRAALEGDVSAGLASGQERQMSANVGTNQGLWYLQAGVSAIRGDGFPMSSDYRPTASEGGGMRDNAFRKDSKISLKVGLTPKGGDEYALSYYKQDGEKGQPPSTVPSAARYWKWPYWNKESLYWVSRTALGASERLKVRLYLDRYDNAVDSYKDGSYTTVKSSGPGSLSTGRSVYNDRSNGGSVELESFRFASHTLRLVGHYKADEHKELDGNGRNTTTFKDTLVSLAGEDTIELQPGLSLSLGLSRHQLRPDSVFSLGNAYTLPATATANDAQAGLFYDWSATARLYASVARKTRLPTLKDRYSQRLGTYIENPALRPEVSLNYELGYQGSPWRGAKAEAAVFYSDIDDKIQSVANVAGNRAQMQNAGQVRVAGVELSLRGTLAPWLELGGNYTLTDLKNVSAAAVKVTDIPRHKITAHALLRPAAGVEVIGFAEHNSGRWVGNTLELAGFTTLNLKAIYRVAQGVALEAGVANLTDKHYALADGFPSAGRTWLLNASYSF